MINDDKLVSMFFDPSPTKVDRKMINENFGKGGSSAPDSDAFDRSADENPSIVNIKIAADQNDEKREVKRSLSRTTSSAWRPTATRPVDASTLQGTRESAI